MLGIKHRIGATTEEKEASATTAVSETLGMNRHVGKFKSSKVFVVTEPSNVDIASTVHLRRPATLSACRLDCRMRSMVWSSLCKDYEDTQFSPTRSQTDSPFSLSRTRSADDPTVPHQPNTEQPPPPPLHTIISTRSVTVCSAAAKASYRRGANCSRRCYHPHSSNSSPSRSYR